MDTPQTSEHYEHPLSTGLENRRDQQKQAYAQTPLFPSESPASLRPKFHLSHLAYTKPILHSLKHHNWFSPPAISGVLLGLPGASQAIVDAVPLYHGPHHMLEDALQAVRSTLTTLYPPLSLIHCTKGYPLCPQSRAFSGWLLPDKWGRRHHI